MMAITRFGQNQGKKKAQSVEWLRNHVNRDMIFRTVGIFRVYHIQNSKSMGDYRQKSTAKFQNIWTYRHINVCQCETVLRLFRVILRNCGKITIIKDTCD